jgi:hypothetical protein
MFGGQLGTLFAFVRMSDLRRAPPLKSQRGQIATGTSKASHGVFWREGYAKLP